MSPSSSFCLVSGASLGPRLMRTTRCSTASHAPDPLSRPPRLAPAPPSDRGRREGRLHTSRNLQRLGHSYAVLWLDQGASSWRSKRTAAGRRLRAVRDNGRGAVLESLSETMVRHDIASGVSCYASVNLIVEHRCVGGSRHVFMPICRRDPGRCTRRSERAVHVHSSTKHAVCFYGSARDEGPYADRGHDSRSYSDDGVL